MFATKASPTFSTDGVAPHDFIDESVATEQPVQLDLDVMDRSVVEVDEQRAGHRQDAAAVLEDRGEPGDERLRIVGSVGVRVAAAVANDAGSKRWIDVDRIERAIAERRELVERVAAAQSIGLGGPSEIDDLARIVGERERREALLRFRLAHDAPHYYDGMKFGPWYALAQAGDLAPAAEGVLQLRLAAGLLDYPRGKSAMVHYAHAGDVRAAASAWADAHGSEGIVCRHLIGIDGTTDLVAFYAKLSEDFVRRFGAPPRLATGWKR